MDDRHVSISSGARKHSVIDEYAQRKAAVKNRRQSEAIEKVLEKADPDIVQASELSEADRKLAELGYVQVYKREFSWLSCISFAFAISGLFGSVTTTFVYPLEAGGLPSATWGWFIAGIGCMCIALSVSELVSAYPTSGGLYFTCKYVAPPNWMAEIAWLTGWLNLLGQIAGIASTEYGTAQLLLAAVAMGNPNYTPTDRQTVGVMAAFTLFHAILNSMNTKGLERLTRGYVIFHLAVLVSCCIALLVMCNNKNSNYDVWVNVTPVAGWSPPGFSFLFGFLSVAWTMTDYDATAHIAEEIQNPERKAPWAIAIALGFTYVGGWLFTIVLAYCAGPDPTGDNGVLNSSLLQPVAQIFYNVLGPAGGIAYTVFALIILNFTSMTGIQAGGRTIWALARDELLPFSSFWYKINKTTQTPLYATWLYCISCVLINLIGLGSYTAISAIFTVTAIALDWSYCIPIICKMLPGSQFQPGPWNLGRASWFVNFWAVLWTLFVSIIFILPTIRPVTAKNMNYACVILVAIFLFAAVYWYVAGRFYYIGPRVKAQVVEDLDTPQTPSPTNEKVQEEVKYN